MNGKKKIVPVVTRQYQGDSFKIDPHMNPFYKQMLKDESAVKFFGGG